MVSLSSFTPEGISNWLGQVLPQVTKPARYLGNEVGAVHKEFSSARITMAFCFPDAYEVGMSHLGIKILYDIINKRPELLCERVFAPWVDMEEAMVRDGVPLFSMESRHLLNEFDVIGFTLQYELSFTNILNMLHLSGVPLRAADRQEDSPIVVGGGPVAYNPEPVADFFDCFLIGEGEESILDFLLTVDAWKATGAPKARLLEALAKVPGCYVPSLYDVTYGPEGVLTSVTPTAGWVPAVVHKRIVKDLNDAEFPREFPVPYMDIVHDRAMVEVLRGCGRGCRFCQAGMVYRPVRERSSKSICELAGALLESTGYEEISLTSLSTADHSQVQGFLTELTQKHGADNVSVSLPSLRADAFSLELAKLAQSVRKTGLTFAPEAGTQRMRDVINKGVTEDGLFEAVGSSFEAGWDQVKLYFMIGLPTETDEDVLAIAALAKRAAARAREAKRAARRGGTVEIGVSVSSFVPKAHTPFQWFPQDSVADIERKQGLLASVLRGKGTPFSWHDARTSFLEGVFSRGDRRLSAVIERAWENGCKFDGWAEHFRYGTWMDAFGAVGLSPEFYANRARGLDEVLPWDHISAGVSKRFLLKEWEQAAKAELTPDCRSGQCGGCGVCSTLGAKVVLAGGEVSDGDV